MINQKEIKRFIELFFEENKIDYHIDKNQIYNVKLIDLLANKLGKDIKFTFNRQVSNDFGVAYLHPKSKILLTFLSYASKLGIETYGKLLPKKNLNNFLLKLGNLSIVKKEQEYNDAIVLLFKISSTNKISDSNPEKLVYYFYDIGQDQIIKSLSEEFHNLEIEDFEFKMSKDLVKLTYNKVIEYLDKELGEIYDEFMIINDDILKKRKEELWNRHEDYKKGLSNNERKIQKQIDDYINRSLNARSFEKASEYKTLMAKKEDELENIKLNNKNLISQHFDRIEKELESEKGSYDFDVNVNLQGLICLKYPIQKLSITNSKDEVLDLSVNLVIDNSIHFICPNCNNIGKELRNSISGYFCCENCSKPFKDSYVCNKDETVLCSMTGETLIPNDSNKCDYCQNYYLNEYLDKSYEGKNICVSCAFNCEISGEKAPKSHLKEISDRNILVLPKYAEMCQFSNKYFLREDLEKTTGDLVLISKDFVNRCRKTGLTFSPKKIENEVWTLFNELKEVETQNLSEKNLIEQISVKKIEFAEDENFILISYKKFFKHYILVYNKKTKQLI